MMKLSAKRICSNRTARALVALLIGFATETVTPQRASSTEPLDARDLVVMIHVDKGAGMRPDWGAGIVVSQTDTRTTIITAWHVVDDDSEKAAPYVISVEFRSLPGHPYVAKLARYADKSIGVDLSVLFIDGGGPPKVLQGDLANSLSTVPASALAGHRVTVVGNTHHRAWDQSLTPQKIVSATPTEILLASSYVAEGSSGGALFDADSGALVGMVLRVRDDRAYALPIQLAIEKLDDWHVAVGLRHDAQSGRIAAERELVQSGYALTAAGLAQALAAADVETLKLFTRAALPATVVAEALRTKKDDGTVAQRYFEATRGSPTGLAWLEEVLGRKDDRLDANLRVPHPSVGEEAIINVAARASNAAAVMMLLRHSANPHGYQHIRDWALGDPRFVFPFGPIWNDAHFEPAEKRQLMSALIDAGAVVVRIPPVATAGGVLYGPIAFETQQLQKLLQTATGQLLPTTLDIRAAPPEKACRRDEALYHVKWCDTVRNMPAVVGRFVPPAREDVFVTPFVVRYYLGADARTAYFLAEELSYGSGYALLETDHDRSQMHLLRFTKQSPLGAARCIDDGERLGFCWRQIDLLRDVRTGAYQNDFGPPLPVSMDPRQAEAQVRARAESVTARPFTHPDPRVAACVNDILRTPREALLDEAVKFNLFATLTLTPRTCVLADAKARLASGDDAVGRVSYLPAQAQICCEQVLGVRHH